MACLGERLRASIGTDMNLEQPNDRHFIIIDNECSANMIAIKLCITYKLSFCQLHSRYFSHQQKICYFNDLMNYYFMSYFNKFE